MYRVYWININDKTFSKYSTPNENDLYRIIIVGGQFKIYKRMYLQNVINNKTKIFG